MYLPKETPPSIPEGLTPEQEQEFLQTMGIAHNLQYRSAGLYLRASTSHLMGRHKPAEPFVGLVNQLLAQSGSPADPVERMLIEQVAMANFVIGELYARAAAADSVERMEIFYKTAARLLGEFRRSAFALKRYQEPAPTGSVRIAQQNIAAHQEVALVSHTPDAGKRTPVQALPVPKNLHSELGSKEAPCVESVPLSAQSPPGARRAAEPAKTPRVDRKRKGKTS